MTTDRTGRVTADRSVRKAAPKTGVKPKPKAKAAPSTTGKQAPSTHTKVADKKPVVPKVTAGPLDAKKIQPDKPGESRKRAAQATGHDESKAGPSANQRDLDRDLRQQAHAHLTRHNAGHAYLADPTAEIDPKIEAEAERRVNEDIRNGKLADPRPQTGVPTIFEPELAEDRRTEAEKNAPATVGGEWVRSKVDDDKAAATAAHEAAIHADEQVAEDNRRETSRAPLTRQAVPPEGKPIPADSYTYQQPDR